MSRSISRQALNRLAWGDSASQVVLHAVRQHRRGKQPSMSYSWIRNPRIALEVALCDLGFASLEEAARMMCKEGFHVRVPRIPTTPAPALSGGPIGFELAFRPISMTVIRPRRPQHYYAKFDLGRGKPVQMCLRLSDAAGKQFDVTVRLNHDLLPGEYKRIIMRGSLLLRQPIWIEAFTGVRYTLSPGIGVQVQISPFEGIFLFEILS